MRPPAMAFKAYEADVPHPMDGLFDLTSSCGCRSVVVGKL